MMFLTKRKPSGKVCLLGSVGRISTLALNDRVISVDRPGQGWSSVNDPALIHLDAQGDLLAELMTVLGLPTATVVGHSLGGSVALAMGLDHPDRLDGLVLMSTPTFSWDENHWWAYRAAEHPILGRIFCTFAVPVIGSLLMDAGGIGISAFLLNRVVPVERSRI